MDNNFVQLCVWPATIVGEDKILEFEQFMLNEFDSRVKYSEEVKTLPTPGNEIEENGGRNDLFFYIHNEDIYKFAIKRLPYGIRWWEDVLGNGGGKIYSFEIIEKYPKTW